MREVPGVDLRRECVQRDPRYGARGTVSTCGKFLDCSTGARIRKELAEGCRRVDRSGVGNMCSVRYAVGAVWCLGLRAFCDHVFKHKTKFMIPSPASRPVDVFVLAVKAHPAFHCCKRPGHNTRWLSHSRGFANFLARVSGAEKGSQIECAVGERCVSTLADHGGAESGESLSPRLLSAVCFRAGFTVGASPAAGILAGRTSAHSSSNIRRIMLKLQGTIVCGRCQVHIVRLKSDGTEVGGGGNTDGQDLERRQRPRLDWRTIDVDVGGTSFRTTEMTLRQVFFCFLDFAKAVITFLLF